MQQLRSERMSTDSTELPQSDLATLHCVHCGWAVREGPNGGYVCGQCFHTEEPPPPSGDDEA